MSKITLGELIAMPCECVRCKTCGGRGYVEDPFDYSCLEPDTCPDCLGDSIEICDRCLELEEIENE